MSTVTKSTDPRYSGRKYEAEDETYYQQRVNYANDLKAKGASHKYAWFQAFQAYPRIYVDETDTTLDSSASDSQPCSFVFP
jgi:hypothetical protein